MILASVLDNWMGLGVAVVLALYLVVALVFPERF